MAKKILIIEDNPTTTRMLRDSLEARGYEVFIADSGEDGIIKAELECPHLIIIDTILPGIDGFEVCRQIREISTSRRPKIIVTTGSVEAVDAKKAREVGADDYCAKTQDFSSLLSSARKLLDNKGS